MGVFFGDIFCLCFEAITVINPGNPVGAVLDREDVVPGWMATGGRLCSAGFSSTVHLGWFSWSWKGPFLRWCTNILWFEAGLNSNESQASMAMGYSWGHVDQLCDRAKTGDLSGWGVPGECVQGGCAMGNPGLWRVMKEGFKMSGVSQVWTNFADFRDSQPWIPICIDWLIWRNLSFCFLLMYPKIQSKMFLSQGKKFHSFKKVLRELQKDDPETYKEPWFFFIPKNCWKKNSTMTRSCAGKRLLRHGTRWIDIFVLVIWGWQDGLAKKSASTFVNWIHASRDLMGYRSGRTLSSSVLWKQRNRCNSWKNRSDYM